jgi:hypothetical protein
VVSSLQAFQPEFNTISHIPHACYTASSISSSLILSSYGEELWRSLLRNSLQPPVTSSLSTPNIFLCTLNPSSSLGATGQVSGKISFVFCTIANGNNRHLRGKSEENHENPSQYSRFAGRHLNQGPPNTKQECYPLSDVWLVSNGRMAMNDEPQNCVPLF